MTDSILGTFLPVPCSSGSVAIGNSLPSLFLDDFINSASATSNGVPYSVSSLQSHDTGDSTATSWYVNLPPPSSISLVSNPNIQPPSINTLASFPNSLQSTVITIPTNSNTGTPICTIKSPPITAKEEPCGVDNTEIFSSIAGTN